MSYGMYFSTLTRMFTLYQIHPAPATAPAAPTAAAAATNNQTAERTLTLPFIPSTHFSWFLAFAWSPSLFHFTTAFFICVQHFIHCHCASQKLFRKE